MYVRVVVVVCARRLSVNGAPFGWRDDNYQFAINLKVFPFHLSSILCWRSGIGPFRPLENGVWQRNRERETCCTMHRSQPVSVIFGCASFRWRPRGSRANFIHLYKISRSLQLMCASGVGGGGRVHCFARSSSLCAKLTHSHRRLCVALRLRTTLKTLELCSGIEAAAAVSAVVVAAAEAAAALVGAPQSPHQQCKCHTAEYLCIHSRCISEYISQLGRAALWKCEN